MRPGQLTILSTVDEFGNTTCRPDYSEGRPLLIWVDPAMAEYVPRGYFKVERPVTTFNYIYADWYAWPYFKGKYLASGWAWDGLKWLVTKRVLRLTTDPRCYIRWRDVRLQLRRCACYRTDKCLAHGGADEIRNGVEYRNGVRL